MLCLQLLLVVVIGSKVHLIYGYFYHFFGYISSLNQLVLEIIVKPLPIA